MQTTIMQRLRRRQRGAAMAEFLVGLPVLILLWAGVDYFRRGYARRLDTLNQSHSAAWQKAYSNDGSCFAGAGAWDKGWNSSTAGSMPTDNGSGQSLDKKFDSTMFLYGTARSTNSQTASSARWSATVQSSTTITCNEVVPTDDRNVLTPLADFIKSFL